MMETRYIKITEYCTQSKVEHTFISALKEEGIIKTEMIDEEDCIDEEKLPELEMFTRWHYDLGINLEGIDAMRHMLNRMNEMKSRISLLERQINS